MRLQDHICMCVYMCVLLLTLGASLSVNCRVENYNNIRTKLTTNTSTSNNCWALWTFYKHINVYKYTHTRMYVCVWRNTHFSMRLGVEVGAVVDFCDCFVLFFAQSFSWGTLIGIKCNVYNFCRQHRVNWALRERLSPLWNWFWFVWNRCRERWQCHYCLGWANNSQLSCLD